MSTQTGTYFLGTFGFPIAIEIGSALTGANGVNLTLTRPDGTVATRSLGLGAITDFATGEVTFSPLSTEVTLSGVYTFVVSVTFPSAAKALVTDGTFYISPSIGAAVGLVIEDGTGLPNSNSYATLEEADDYHAKRLYSDDWANKSNEEKARALIMATRTLDQLFYWNGIPKRLVPGVQMLGWPRVPEVIESQWGNPVPNYYFWRNLMWPYDQVPMGIKYATIEFARELQRADRTLEPDTKGIQSVSVGQGAVSITFDPKDRKVVVTDPIIAMLKPFGTLIGKNPSSVALVR